MAITLVSGSSVNFRCPFIPFVFLPPQLSLWDGLCFRTSRGSAVYHRACFICLYHAYQYVSDKASEVKGYAGKEVKEAKQKRGQKLWDGGGKRKQAGTAVQGEA